MDIWPFTLFGALQRSYSENTKQNDYSSVYTDIFKASFHWLYVPTKNALNKSGTRRFYHYLRAVSMRQHQVELADLGVISQGFPLWDTLRGNACSLIRRGLVDSGMIIQGSPLLDTTLWIHSSWARFAREVYAFRGSMLGHMCSLSVTHIGALWYMLFSLHYSCFKVHHRRSEIRRCRACCERRT